MLTQTSAKVNHFRNLVLVIDYLLENLQFTVNDTLFHSSFLLNEDYYPKICNLALLLQYANNECVSKFLKIAEGQYSCLFNPLHAERDMKRLVADFEETELVQNLVVDNQSFGMIKMTI